METATLGGVEARPWAQAPEVGLEILPFSRPARTFSGDFYRYRTLSGGTFFAIGDVRGKGLDAAVIMAMIQEVLEEREAGIGGPADLLALTLELDRMLLREGDAGCFASMVLGHVASDGRVDLVNAGHCPPLIVGVGSTVKAIPAHGPPLGLLPGLSWEIGSERLGRGETLGLYTDGVVEAASPADEQYGVERVASALRALAPQPLARVATGLLEEVRRHTGAAEFEDDVTLLLLRRG